MKAFDRTLQRWRINQVSPHIPLGARVLDIGCSDGELFEQVPGIIDGVGIDPLLTPKTDVRYKLVRGWFPDELPNDHPFDVIALLAVLEHIPPDKQEEFAHQCAARLKPHGRLVVTVPSPLVDHILHFLRLIRVVDGMAMEQHYGFDATLAGRLFERAGLRLVRHKRFELGLNHTYVFENPSDAGD